jgi:glucose dehydrogenase
MNSDIHFDVCIIGSGPASAVLGKSLVGNKIRTVIIESGPDPNSKSIDPRFRALEVYSSSGTVDYPIAESRFRALGGSTNIWTGRCPRLHPIDFEKNAYTPDGAPWPITYNELEPYYVQAEKTLRVRGGVLSDYNPPRSRALPFPPDLDILGLKAIMEEVGITVDDSPTSTSRKTKAPIGLIIDLIKGKRSLSVAEDILPDFVSSRHAVLLSGLTVTRIIPDAAGRIIGVESMTLDGIKRIVRARVIVVACGGIESPRLLLLSRSKNYPNGIGNNNDLLGRYFMEHPRISFYGKLRHKYSTISPFYKVGRSYQFYEQFKLQGLGSVRMSFMQSWVFPDELKDLGFSNFLENLYRLIGRIIKPYLMISATCEMLPSRENRITLTSDLIDLFGNPAADLSLNFSFEDLRTMENVRALIRKIYKDLEAHEVVEADITWSHHHIGTCRMGDNPNTSVVDPNLRVHGIHNLYVLGSSVFVTGGASPPTLTIVAFSHRLAEHLILKLRKGQ